MVGRATPHVIRWRPMAVGIVVLMTSTGVAWALAYPDNSLSDSLIRGMADAAAMVVLGLAIVPRFDEARYRNDLVARAAAPLIAVSWLWVTAELVRTLGAAAQATGAPLTGLGVGAAVEFVTGTAAGRSALLSLAAAAVCLVVAMSSRAPAGGVVIAGVAALGLVGRGVVGHLSGSAAGGVAVAVHALAAALWCGSMAALVLVVDRRGQWARVLPRFASMSFGCVVVLIACGVAGALVTVPSAAALVTTGYGRLLLAKVLITGTLVALAWRNRAHWLPAARTHRATAEVSLLRSRVELTVMAVAVVLAAALAVTA